MTWRKFKAADLQEGLVIRNNVGETGAFADTLVVKVFKMDHSRGYDSEEGVSREEILAAVKREDQGKIHARLWRPYAYVHGHGNMATPLSHGESYSVPLSHLLESFETCVLRDGPSLYMAGFDRWQDRIVMHHATNEGRATMMCDRSLLVVDVLAVLKSKFDETAAVMDVYPSLTEADVHACRCWQEMVRDLAKHEAASKK